MHSGECGKLPGTEIPIIPTLACADHDAALAFEYTSATERFLRKALARQGIDGLGSPLIVTLRHPNSPNQAYWNGSQVVLGVGDGLVFRTFLADPTIMAHEFFHGVIDAEGGFTYRDQAGAVSEHLSDVFAIVAAHHAKKDTPGDHEWMIGARMFTAQIDAIGLRCLDRPGQAYNDPAIGRDRQPYHMRDYVLTNEDRGGIHINSGIPNHAFYQFVSLLGEESWKFPVLLWYRSLLRAPKPDITFTRWVETTLAECAELRGARSIEYRTLTQSWKLVGF